MSHRYRVYPEEGQEPMMLEHCGQARFVWNLALEQVGVWRSFGRRADDRVWDRQLAELRGDVDWLAAGSSVVQQAALRDLRQAFQNWWAGTHRRPTKRKRGHGDGFAIRDLTVKRLSRKWATVHVPKVGPVRFRLSRPLPERTKSARVTLDRAGRWHVSFTAIPAQVEGPGDGSVVGVDRGVANTVALSTGDVLHAPTADWQRIARLQRRMARQQKGSGRRARTRHQLARVRARETDRRKDWVEQATTVLASRFDLVVIEDLRVPNMVRSARGTLAEPGRNVAQKAGLNRSILQQSWGLFARRLGDKLGARLLKVNPAFTSQECSTCRKVDTNSRKSQTEFVCTTCGMVDHADVNAAKVIAARGQRASGRGGTRARGRPGETSTTLVGEAA